MKFSSVLALVGSLTSTYAQIKGFNYGSTYSDGSAIDEAGYEGLFNTAKGLVGSSGFTSARLYTTIQAGTTDSPTAAIQAAINTQTTLLIGLWASAGQPTLDAEIAALTAAIQQHGTAFTSLIDGISVGSEDLYRISPTGIINNSGAGADPDVIVNFISQVRAAISGTPASSKPVGHVDTWTAWVNGSNSAVISASDFIGMDAYPYFQNTQANSIDNGASLFFSAYDQTIAAAGSKPVWVTESGWPVSGPTEAEAVPSIANAQTYWDQVACKLFTTTNTWWYTLQDSAPVTPSPSFGLIGSTLTTTPLYDLTCPAAGSSSSTTSTSAPTVSANPSPPVSSLAGSAAPPDNDKGASATPVTSSQALPAGGPSASNPVSSETTTTTVIVYATVTSCPVTNNYVSQSTTIKTTELSPSTVTFTTTTTIAAPTSSQLVGPSSSPTSKTCPASIESGAFEFPHLIVPIDKSNPNQAGGTSYNGIFSATVSSIFNFDVPASDKDKTCSLIFLLPTKDMLTTSSFTLTGNGGLKVSELVSPATEDTSASTVPAVSAQLGTTADVVPGSAFTISTFACPAGERVGFEFEATGTLDLEYFQDYNPSAIGAYITVC